MSRANKALHERAQDHGFESLFADFSLGEQIQIQSEANPNKNLMKTRRLVCKGVAKLDSIAVSVFVCFGCVLKIQSEANPNII